VISSLIRLRALLAKEFRQLLRDPRMRFFVVVPPLIQLLVLGYAASFDVREARIAVVDHAQTRQSRDPLPQLPAAATSYCILSPPCRGPQTQWTAIRCRSSYISPPIFRAGRRCN